MPKNRRTFTRRHAADDKTPVPFTSAEEAWFWFMRCQKLRNDGVKLSPDSSTHPRPCEPDDVYRTAKMLHRQNRLQKEHLAVMARFGLLERPPDGRDHRQKRAALIWNDAMDRMLAPLRQKGIVACGGARQCTREGAREHTGEWAGECAREGAGPVTVPVSGPVCIQAGGPGRYVSPVSIIRDYHP